MVAADAKKFCKKFPAPNALPGLVMSISNAFFSSLTEMFAFIAPRFTYSMNILFD